MLLAVSFFVFGVTAAEEPEPTAATTDVGGKVLAADRRPAVAVEVLTYHLATAELFTAKTDGTGEYTFSALPHGYYDLAIRATDGLYIADQVAHVSAEDNPYLELRLGTPSPLADLRLFAGANEAPIGKAIVIDPRSEGPSFWRSPKGIGTVAGGGALLLGLLGGGGSDAPASPFMPLTTGP